MRHTLSSFGLAALAGLIATAGLTAAPQTAEAGRLGRAVGTAVVVGAAKSTTRRAIASDRRNDRDENSEGDVKAVDYEARTREAQAKLAAERQATPPSEAPLPAAAPIETRNKVVCVAGCY